MKSINVFFESFSPFFISSFKNWNKVHSLVNGLFLLFLISIKYSFTFFEIFIFNSGVVLLYIKDNKSKKLSSMKLKLFFSFFILMRIKSINLLSFIHLNNSFFIFDSFMFIILFNIKTIISLINNEYLPFKL